MADWPMEPSQTNTQLTLLILDKPDESELIASNCVPQPLSGMRSLRKLRIRSGPGEQP